MDFGVSIFVTDETVAPGPLGRLVEERGFRSLYVPEHTHIPLDHPPPPAGGELARRYKRALDPFVVLTAAAATTTTLRLGFGICLVVQRHPLTTAKAVASLDLVSGGRVEFGVGAGWNRPEIEHHGTPFEHRFRVMRERVEAMRALWTQDQAEYHGRFVDFGPSWSWPKPVQDPLPVFVGGTGDGAVDRVLRWGDHWLPNKEPRLAERVADLRSRADATGRPRPRVTFFGAVRDAAAVERLAAAGVDEILLGLPSAGAGEVEQAADEAAVLAAEYAAAP